MFEQQQQQAHTLAAKIQRCKDLNNQVPDAEKVSRTQIQGLESTTENLVKMAFGASSEEFGRYQQVFNCKSELRDRAYASGDPQWDFTYWIDYFELLEELLRELEARYLHHHLKQHGMTMGDTYHISGQVGAVGANASASHVQMAQTQAALPAPADYPALARELADLRVVLLAQASAPAHFAAIGEVARAEQGAQQQDGNTVVKSLVAAGKWVLDIAKDTGKEVLVELIKKQAGI